MPGVMHEQDHVCTMRMCSHMYMFTYMYMYVHTCIHECLPLDGCMCACICTYDISGKKLCLALLSPPCDRTSTGSAGT